MKFRFKMVICIFGGSFISCGGEQISSIKKEPIVDSTHSFQETPQTNAEICDSLINIHKDSMLFMNYWSGMTESEFEKITEYEKGRLNVFEIDGKFFTPLFFNETEYLFQITYIFSEPHQNNYQSDYPIPPNGYIELVAYKCARKPNSSSTYSLNGNDTIWIECDRYDLGSNSLDYSSYYEIDKVFDKKYSNNSKHFLDKKISQVSVSPYYREFRRDNNKFISFRSLPFPDKDFRVWFWSNKKGENPPSMSEIKEIQRRQEKLSTKFKTTTSIDEEYDPYFDYFDKNLNLITPYKSFSVIYMSQSSYEFIEREFVNMSNKKNKENINSNKQIEEKESNTIDKI